MFTILQYSLMRYLIITIFCIFEVQLSTGSNIETVNCDNFDNVISKIPTLQKEKPEELAIINCSLLNTSYALDAAGLQTSSLKRLTIQFRDNSDDKGEEHGVKIIFLQKHFEGLESLESLKISGGDLFLGPDLFKGLSKLSSVTIEADFLELSGDTFKYADNLETLDLSYCGLKNLSFGMFENLQSLDEINIYGNELENLQKETFRGLENLKLLNIYHNNLILLESDVFQHLPNLRTISMGKNKFKNLPDELFNPTPNLEEFYLEHNEENLIQIPSRLFSKLTKLKKILIKTSVANVSSGLFKDSIHLQEIVLHCNMPVIPNDLFKQLKKLTILNLAMNLITDIRVDDFTDLRNLTILNLSHNRIKNIEPDAFLNLESVKEINLNSNKLVNLRSVFHDLKKLKYLYLRNNYLNQILSINRLDSLENLDMSHNMIKKFSHEDFQMITSNVTIDLSHNNITTVNFTGFEKGTLSRNGNITFSLDTNMLVCDCSMYHFIHHIQSKEDKRFNFQLDNLMCNEPMKFLGKLVSSLSKFDLHCLLEDDSCPDQCNCKRRIFDETLVINCTHQNLTSVPVLPNANSLNLNQTELHINNNLITELPSINDPGYNFVTKLYAANNLISKLKTANIPKRLEEVDLRHNKFTTLNFGVVEIKTKLSGNPWECGCNDIFWVYLQNNHKNVSDYDTLRCTNQTLLKLLSPSYCLNTLNEPLIWICVTIAVLGLFVGSLVALFYKYQQVIKVWMYAHNICLWLVTEYDLDKDKKYDAFISYSHKDEEFITEQLLPKLECEPNPYKLCLHFRDWMPGEMIPSQIAKSVEDSRRTLVVLSQNFIESVWGQMEFRTAHSQAMSEGRSRVIIIIYGTIEDEANMDQELNNYIKMNTYVKWGDTYFWNKLKYALPHLRR